MGGTTAAGIPYVTPDDHPKEYPAVSQQLAETLSQGLLPIGAVIAYGGTAAPQGWHLCDGTPHGSPDLADLIGPNTPDLRGRFVLAASSARPAASEGGAETVPLTTAQMPSHSHGGVTAGQSQTHSHSNPTGNYQNWNIPGSGVGYENILTIGGGTPYDPGTGGASTDHTHGISAEGSGAAHENMPPYYALTYIIKAL